MRREQMDGDTEMTEETAVRIAEALETIDGDIGKGLILVVGLCVISWIITVLKN